MAQTVHLKMTSNGNDVEGESTITTLEREGTIECLSFNHIMESTIERGGLPSGKMVSQGIRIEKRIDKSTPLLQKAMDNAETIEGTFSFYRPHPGGDGTEQHFFSVRMENARISMIDRTSWNVFGSEGANPPMEEIIFVAGEVRWTYEDGGAEHTTEFFAKKK